MPKNMIGKYVVDVRPMTREEKKTLGWKGTGIDTPMVIELNDGTRIVAGSDDQGEHKGFIFTLHPDDELFLVHKRVD